MWPEETEVTFSAHFTDEDKAELEEVAASAGKKALIFPGVIVSNGGTAAAATAMAKNKFTFKLKTKALTFEGKTYLAHPIVNVTKLDAKDGVVTLAMKTDVKYPTFMDYAKTL